MFDKFTRLLRAENHSVFNPIASTRNLFGADVYDSPENFARITGKVVFAKDMKWLIEEADAICMLFDWQNSDGAVAEHATAKAFGKKIFFLERGVPPGLLKDMQPAAILKSAPLPGCGNNSVQIPPRAYTITKPGIDVAAPSPAEVERRLKIEALQKKIHSEIVSAPGPLDRRTFSVMQEIVDLL